MGNGICRFPSERQKHKRRESLGQKEVSYELGPHKDDAEYSTPESRLSEAGNEDKQPVCDSGDPTFVCEICVEAKVVYDSFNPKGCSHFFCSGCVVRYVTSKLEENLVTLVSCPVPGCSGLLDPEFCRGILPNNVFDKWGIALCEYVIDGSKKFYCPYKNCSALLINDLRKEVKYTECPCCKRGFCAKCKVAWHSEMDCARFQKLRKKGEDAMLADLAKRKNWRRCSKCKHYVEKSAGCFYMKCRCGYAFCYKCGARSSTTFHVCQKCKH